MFQGPLAPRAHLPCWGQQREGPPLPPVLLGPAWPLHSLFTSWGCCQRALCGLDRALSLTDPEDKRSKCGQGVLLLRALKEDLVAVWWPEGTSGGAVERLRWPGGQGARGCTLLFIYFDL